MKKENCTKGPVKWKGRQLVGNEQVSERGIVGTTICNEGEFFPDNEERTANRKLIWQAFSVLHETGYTPRELAETVEEMCGVIVRLKLALLELGDRDEFGGDAPEFNEGGEQYEAITAASTILAKYQPKNPA